MRCIETMKGDGTVTADDGEQFSVKYELNVYQDEIPAGNMDDPRATIPGLKDIRGWVEPVRLFDQTLTLEMQDGRKLKFFFTDSHGNIALRQWIG